MLKVVAGILTVSMLLSDAPVTTIVSAFEKDPSQPELQLNTFPEEILATYPGPEEEPEYKIIAEAEDKKEEFTKHFQTEQQTFVAAMYDEPVHYELNGQWRDIDNRLILRANEDVFENRASVVDVRIARLSNTDEMVSVERDGREISWGLALPMTLSDETPSASEFQVDQTAQPMALAVNEEPVTQEEIEQYNQKKMTVTKTKSSGTYHDILPNMDIQYVLESNTVKENIVVKDRAAAGQTILFRIQHSGMESRLEEDGSVSIFDPQARKKPSTVLQLTSS